MIMGKKVYVGRVEEGRRWNVCKESELIRVEELCWRMVKKYMSIILLIKI